MRLLVLAAAVALGLACGKAPCAAGDAGPSPTCCQPAGNSCATGADCCSGTCITRTQPGFCCGQPGGCP